MLAFRSLRRRLLQPLLILSAIAALSGVIGVYWLSSKALHEDLQQRGQLLSSTLIISAETSSSLADFHRTVLANASEPSIDNIMLLNLDYQPIFHNDQYDIDSHEGEKDYLESLIQQAKDTGLSIGALDPHNNDIYKVVSSINISALPQENIFKPKESILVISLQTTQARKDALIGAAWLTALFIGIGLVAFSSIYYLMNNLVLKPSQKIVAVMRAHSLKQDITTGLLPEHELGLIGQTFDQLSHTLKAREQELQLALTQAQDASLAKSQFLASMSHEIRTPMNGVIGMLHLLNKEPLNEKQQHYTQLATSSADSLLTLINDILDVSKIEAGKLDIEIIDFDLHQLFKQLTNTMTPRIEDKDLKIILDLKGVKNEMVKGDPGRIRQILTNLIGNAIKFTPAGEITLRASLSPINQDNKLILQCDVIDTGIGIVSSKLDQLFDSFTQADSSTTRKYGGTGLGLSIVKQLCQLMGGDIFVSSTLGQGSQFSFTVTLDSSDKKTPSLTGIENTDNKTLLNINNNNASKPRILLVEDNRINQLVALGILENLGFQAEAKGDGQEAISALQQTQEEPFSLILMDCQMPIMDGFTTTQNIRTGMAGKQYRDITIVAMTANAMQGDRGKCIQSGMNDYLTKPIDEKLLAQCLLKWLQKRELNSNQSIESNDLLDQPKALAWDKQLLMERLNNQEALFFKVIQLFLKDMPLLINKLEHQIEQGEVTSISETIHSIRGVAANISATELYNLCVAIEEKTHLGLAREIVDEWPEFNRVYQRLYQQVSAEINSSSDNYPEY